MPEKNKACRICGEATSFGDHTLCRRRVREAEDERRLARYDEAVSLLLDSRHLEGNAFPAIWRAARDAFLAAEPKTEERNG